VYLAAAAGGFAAAAEKAAAEEAAGMECLKAEAAEEPEWRQALAEGVPDLCPLRLTARLLLSLARQASCFDYREDWQASDHLIIFILMYAYNAIYL
jgi:hypothetical protein